MFSECSTLPRNNAAHHRWADESGEQIGAIQKLVVVLASLVIAGSTAFAVAMPFALLHLR